MPEEGTRLNGRIIIVTVLTGLLTFTIGYSISWYTHPTNEDYNMLLANFTSLQANMDESIKNIEDSIETSLTETTRETDDKIENLNHSLLETRGQLNDSIQQTKDSLSLSIQQIQDDLLGSPADVYKKVNRSLVTVIVRIRRGWTGERHQGVDYRFGSGFVYDDEGHIVTNHHVIDGYEPIKGIRVVFYDGSEQWASFIQSDTYSDLAVIKIEPSPENPPIPLAEYSEFEVGDPCIAIGSPYGYDSSVTYGVISHKGRAISYEEYSVSNVIQFDASINPGSSGGVLLSRDGKVIGVTTAGVLGGDGIGFAIGSELVDKIVSTLVLRQKVGHPYLGVHVIDMNLQLADEFEINTSKGLYITKIEKSSPAELAGLKEGTYTGPQSKTSYVYKRIWSGGDVILKIDDLDVTTFDDFASYLDLYKSPGDNVTLTILRNNLIQEIEVTLGETPD